MFPQGISAWPLIWSKNKNKNKQTKNRTKQNRTEQKKNKTKQQQQQQQDKTKQKQTKQEIALCHSFHFPSFYGDVIILALIVSLINSVNTRSISTNQQAVTDMQMS